MNRIALAASLAAFLGAGAASAQNTTEPARPPAGERPKATTPQTPPPSSAEPPAGSEQPATPPPATEIVPVPVVVPQPQAAPAPIELPMDEPYPNGFADPSGAYGNDLSVAVRQENDGLDWGLLGLLGLFGLFGLYRRDGYRQVMHSERVDERYPPRP